MSKKEISKFGNTILRKYFFSFDVLYSFVPIFMFSLVPIFNGLSIGKLIDCYCIKIPSDFNIHTVLNKIKYTGDLKLLFSPLSRIELFYLQYFILVQLIRYTIVSVFLAPIVEEIYKVICTRYICRDVAFLKERKLKMEQCRVIYQVVCFHFSIFEKGFAMANALFSLKFAEGNFFYLLFSNSLGFTLVIFQMFAAIWSSHPFMGAYATNEEILEEIPKRPIIVHMWSNFTSNLMNPLGYYTIIILLNWVPSFRIMNFFNVLFISAVLLIFTILFFISNLYYKTGMYFIFSLKNGDRLHNYIFKGATYFGLLWDPFHQDEDWGD